MHAFYLFVYLFSTLFSQITKETWKNYTVIASKSPPGILQSYSRTLASFFSVQTNPSFVQFLGYCNGTSQIFTEYHKLADATLIGSILRNNTILDEHQKSMVGFRLCLDYSATINELHRLGRYLCDGNELRKLVSQFLLTDNLRLVVGDMDSLYKAGLDDCPNWFRKFPKFTAREFIEHENDTCALTNQTCRDTLYVIHTRADVWKIPDVCEFFLRDDKLMNMKANLKPFHRLCKNEDYMERPSMKHVVEFYTRMFLDVYGEHHYENFLFGRLQI